MRGTQRSRQRAGITLVECVVVLSLVALLASLLLPAAMSARQAAIRVQCLNNLKQIALATQAYADLHQVFPSSTGYGSGSRVQLRLYSAFTQILPQLEQNPLFNAINFEVQLVDDTGIPPDWGRDASSPANRTAFAVVVNQFLCPADSLPQSSRGTGGVGYRANLGSNSSPNNGDSRQFGPFSRMQRSIGIPDVTDGLSNTASFSERSRGRDFGSPYDPARDILLARMQYGLDPSEALDACSFQDPAKAAFRCCAGATWSVASPSQTTYDHWQLPNGRIPDCGLGFFMPIQGRIGARSEHRGVVNMAMADGSVRPVPQGIDLKVWRATGSIAGGEVFSWGD